MAEGTRQLWASSGRLPEGIIYPELIHSGMVETLVQNTDSFNAASNNTIRLVNQRRRGDFAQESFFKNVSSIVNRRINESGSPENAPVTSNPVPMDEFVSVKLNRRVGPIDQTLDSFRKLGNDADLEVLSRLLGSQIAKAIQIDQLDTALRALVAGITNIAALTENRGPAAGSPEETLSTDGLVDGLAKFGDAGSQVVMWVMHSKPFYDLVKNQIGLNIDGISNFNIATATPVTLNRPVLITDSASLVSAAQGSPEETQYTTLGLVADGAILEDSEEESLMGDLITGKENLVVRLQGEFAYNVKLKGFAWDVANGGVNPTNATIATGSNWDSVMDNNKDLAGFAIQSL
jgi:hypothetical protein